MNLDNYEKLRPQMQTGDILEFHTEGSIVSRMIRWWTKEFNHTGIIVRLIDLYRDLYESVIVYEAHASGIDRSYLSRVLGYHRGYVKWYPLKDVGDKTRQQISVFVNHAQLRHTPYDKSSLIAQMRKRTLVDADELYCTELAQWALIKGGVIEDTPDNRIALRPGELAKTFPEIFRVPEGVLI